MEDVLNELKARFGGGREATWEEFLTYAKVHKTWCTLVLIGKGLFIEKNPASGPYNTKYYRIHYTNNLLGPEGHPDRGTPLDSIIGYFRCANPLRERLHKAFALLGEVPNPEDMLYNPDVLRWYLLGRYDHLCEKRSPLAKKLGAILWEEHASETAHEIREFFRD